MTWMRTRAVLAASAVLALALAAPAAADDLNGGGDYPISVTVTDDGTTSPGSGSSGSGDGLGFGSAGDSGSGFGSGSSGFGSSGASDAVDTGASPAGSTGATDTKTKEADAAFSLGGIRLGYGWSPNPSEGTLSTSVTVHNGTAASMPVTVRAWMTGPFGNRIGGPVEREVVVPARGDREVRIPVEGVAQWTVVTAHLEVTPPKSAGGIELSKLVREQTLVVAPWLILAGIVVVAGVGYPLSRLVRRPRAVEAFA